MQRPDVAQTPEPLTPFTIEVPEAVLADLRQRLERMRLPNSIAGMGWLQGTELEFLSKVLAHWRDGYDWRRTEALLNRFEQIVTTVDGQSIHLVHVRCPKPDAIPLMLIHGWPGSVMEFLDVIEPLSAEFHVVVPSLPGFTFSGPTTERGWHPGRIASAFSQIMDRLGYARYGLQGGDWGSVVATLMADLRPERVIGLHLNFVSLLAPPPKVPLEAEDQRILVAFDAWRQTGIGYQAIQTTRPQSLGYGLEDSPAGLAGWILEKFQEWSHADIQEAYTLDRLLDNLTAYWVTGTATSSLRIYWEMRQSTERGFSPPNRIEVPTAVALFPGEVNYPPKSWIEAAYNVVRWSQPARGGHFAAMEAPAEFTADVTAFFRGFV